jgi:hypothetical protein
MSSTVSGAQRYTQPTQQPDFIQQQLMLQTERNQEYAPVFPRGLGFGFPNQNVSSSFPISAQAPMTWQSSASPFGDSEGRPSLAWGWGEGGQ